jgi:hypothetical protein
MRYRAQGVTVGWHPAVHPLSLPVPVSASASVPQEPIGKAVMQAYTCATGSAAAMWAQSDKVACFLLQIQTIDFFCVCVMHVVLGLVAC